jgi:hypothetical protein
VNPTRASAEVGAAATGYAVARALIPRALEGAPRLVRANVRGRPVPVALGGPLAVGTLAGIAAGASLKASGRREPGAEMQAAAAVLVAVFAVAGHVDDLAGDESARGFGGHLRQLRRGRVSGGVIKMIAGALGGLAAGVLVRRRAPVTETAALVALSANLLNLLDRAPGRAAKAALATGVPLVARHSPWRAVGCALAGATIACLPADLDEAGMLGDAGSNPMGALVGLGLACDLRRPWRLVVIGCLVALNAASERHSFSELIERNRWLRLVDGLGRLPGNRSGS